MTTRIDRDLDEARARKAELERRQVILYRGLQQNAQRDERGLMSDRWEELAELYDKCGDQIGTMNDIIESWEQVEEETSPRRLSEAESDRRWHMGRVL